MVRTRIQIIPPPNIQSELLYLWKRYRVEDSKQPIQNVGHLIQVCQTEIRRKAHNYLSLQKRLDTFLQWFYQQETITPSYRITNLLPPEDVENHLKRIQRSTKSKCHRCRGEGFIVTKTAVMECQICDGSGYR